MVSMIILLDPVYLAAQLQALYSYSITVIICSLHLTPSSGFNLIALCVLKYMCAAIVMELIYLTNTGRPQSLVEEIHA